MGWFVGAVVGAILVVTGVGIVVAQITHSNGLGQTYSDATPLGTPGNPGTYTQMMAAKARAIWPVGGSDADASCPSGSTYQRAVYRQTATSCALWAYTGSSAGHVKLNSQNRSCYCPTMYDPPWN